MQTGRSYHCILSTMLLELFSKEGEHPRCPKAVVRRFILWSLVCWISAAPSFGLVTLGRSGGRNSEVGGFDPWAMACAITLFSILYTILTTSAAFDRFHRIRGVRRTLYIGYWTRIAVSIIFPVSFVVDVIPGAISILAVSSTLGIQSGFVATFLITCVHGTLMNLIIAIYMGMLYPIVLNLTKDPNRPGGFEVILPEATLAEKMPQP